MGLGTQRVGCRFEWRQRSTLALLLLAACAGTPAVLAPPSTAAQAQRSFNVDVAYCQRVRASRVSTLGPTIFQPISGDEGFNECVTRAKANLDLAMLQLE